MMAISRTKKKESATTIKLFSFLWSTLDVIRTTATFVVGVGAALGILLNTSGYGHVLPSKDRIYVKI